MKLLGNSSWGISLIQKQLLYRCCTLPITLYGFQLWFYNKILVSYHMKILNKIQRRAAIWILGAFKTSLLEGIEAIAGIIPIKYHIQKIAKKSQLYLLKLSNNHILRNLLDDSTPWSNLTKSHIIGLLTNHQRLIIKDHLIDLNTKSYGIFPAFSSLNPEFSPGHCIIDNFSN